MSGRFITLEGGEGAGKTTQARLLAEWLRERGFDVIETHEPGGTPGADAIRALLLDPATPLTPLAEAHLFAAARADHVARLIAPALAESQWVVCDRFVDSSLAYQGIAGALGVEVVAAINARAIAGATPDLTLLLRFAADEGVERAEARDDGATDRFGAKGAAFHFEVVAAFDALAAAHPTRIVPIDAEGDIESVAARIRDAVAERLL